MKREARTLLPNAPRLIVWPYSNDMRLSVFHLPPRKHLFNGSRDIGMAHTHDMLWNCRFLTGNIGKNASRFHHKYLAVLAVFVLVLHGKEQTGKRVGRP